MPRSGSTAGWVIAMLLSGVSGAAPAVVDMQASQWQFLADPLSRHLFVQTATPADIDGVNGGFLAGRWIFFGAWADLVRQAKIVAPPPGAAPSPHQRFWASWLKTASPEEKRELLDYLLQAQLANPSVRELRRELALPAPSPKVRARLVEYLAQFDPPRHSVEPDAALGGDLQAYAFVPDERLIHLAGQLSLREAVPALAKLLTLERHIFRRFTDYSTSPGEVNRVVPQTVLALVRIGGAGAKAEVKKAFADALGRLPKQTGDEIYWLETRNEEREGVATSVRKMIWRELASTLKDAGVEPTRSWIERGVAALDGDPRALSLLFPTPPLAGEAAWTLPMRGQAELQGVTGSRMYLRDGGDLEALEPSTGATVFRVTLSNGYASTSAGPLVQRPGGGLFLFGLNILTLHGQEQRRWLGAELDPSSGEVRRSFPLALTPTQPAAPTLIIGVRDGFLIQWGELLWLQNEQGRLVWKTKLDPQALVRVEGDHLVLLDESTLSALQIGSGKAVWERPVSALLQTLGGFEGLRHELALFPEGPVVFPFPGPAAGLDWNGGLRWMRSRDRALSSSFSSLAPAGSFLFGTSGWGLCRLQSDGATHFLDHGSDDSPDEGRFAAGTAGAAFLSDSSVLYFWDGVAPRATKVLTLGLPFELPRVLAVSAGHTYLIFHHQNADWFASMPVPSAQHPSRR